MNQPLKKPIVRDCHLQVLGDISIPQIPLHNEDRIKWVCMVLQMSASCCTRRYNFSFVSWAIFALDPSCKNSWQSLHKVIVHKSSHSPNGMFSVQQLTQTLVNNFIINQRDTLLGKVYWHFKNGLKSLCKEPQDFQTNRIIANQNLKTNK